MTFSKSPLFVSSTLFLLLLGSALSGFGNLIIYVFFLMASVFYLLTGDSRDKMPKSLLPLAFCLFLYVVYSSFFALDIVTHVLYSSLYISCFLTTLFAFRFPQQAVFLLVCFAFALSALALTGLFYPGGVVRFFIDSGIDTNYAGYFLVAGIFSLLKYRFYRPGLNKIMVSVLFISGMFFDSRSFVLVCFFMFFLMYWEKLRYGRSILVVGLLGVIYALFSFINENPVIVSAIISALNFDLDLSGVVADKRRLELFATGIQAVKEFFPFGTGMGPGNYKAAIMASEIEVSPSLRLGYPHNYYISAVAQAGVAGVLLVTYLTVMSIQGRRAFPVIAALVLGLAFNEYIGISALWIFIGVYLNERAI